MGYREIAEGLLDEGEGPTLDFKQTQYKFDLATDEEKSELIKDILAFANAFRRSDAYIFIGTEDVPGARAKILGITDHIDDAKIQQLVNSKTNRAIDFIYVPLELEGKKVALIHIPVQQRPFYLLKDFGKLKKGTVYFRRGSSTDIADPDEISRMGQMPTEPVRASKLSGFLVAGEHDEIIEKHVTLDALDAEIPPEEAFPLYGDYPDAGPFAAIARTSSFHKNEKYYIEHAKWQKEMLRVTEVAFAVKNAGNSVATDVRLILTIKKTPDFNLKLADDLPSEPSKSKLDFAPAAHSRPMRYDIRLQTTSTGWKVVVSLGKVQAMDANISRDSLCIEAFKSTDIPMAAQIFADDLTQPISDAFEITLTVTKKTLSVAELTHAAAPDEDE